MHEPTPPTLDEYGNDTHPAFGYIQAHRSTGSPAVLFDSEIVHNNFVTVTIGRMTRKRDLNRDWLHPSSKIPLVEVQMSEAQWAQFVSSMNSSATACTIRTAEGDWDTPGLEFAPRLALSAEEANSAAERVFARIKEAMAVVDAMDSKTPAKERRAAMRALSIAVEHSESTIEFATESLRKHTEDVVQKAKADVEAMVVHKAQALGLDPAQFGTTLEIEAGEGED